MKKKVFSLMATVLFIGSSISLNANNSAEFGNPDEEQVCAMMAFIAQGAHEAAGLPKHLANALANELYEDCME